MWQLCKRVHSIHVCILVKTTTIICITVIITVEWLIIYPQYSLKFWSPIFVVAYCLTFSDYLELGSSSEVEDNRRWVSSRGAKQHLSWLPLRCCEPSDAMVIMSWFHQRYRGTFVITQLMEVFGIETMFWSLVELLCFKSFSAAHCFNQILFLLKCCAAFRLLNNLLLPLFKLFIDFVCLRVWWLRILFENPNRFSQDCSIFLFRLRFSLKLFLISWDKFYLVNALLFFFFWSLRYFHRL